MDNTQAEINNIQAQIQKYSELIAQKEGELAQAEKQEQQLYELFCERVAIYFPVETLTVTHFTGVLVDKTREDALGLCGPDALFGTEYLVLLPQSHLGFETFDETIRRYVPEIETKPYRPLTCDQNGHHHD